MRQACTLLRAAGRGLAAGLLVVVLSIGLAGVAGAQSGPTPAALYAEGMRYHNGEGVAQNYATAAEWLTQAADAGHAPAQNQLGQYYFTGLGVTQDAARALHWLGAAAETGTPAYMIDYAAALEAAPDGLADPATAFALYARAAETGDLEAKVRLAVLYHNGTGTAQDLPRAIALYNEAAATGHPRALNNLGLIYVRGSGVAQDYPRAAELFAAAADRGLAEAARNLGVMYENGFGVPVDEEKAAALYAIGGRGGAAQASTTPEPPAAADDLALVYDARLVPVDAASQEALARAAQAGDPVAQFQMGWLLATAETPDWADVARAAHLFEAAAHAGLAPAMMNLGLMYFDGRGVPQDYELGQMWLLLANAAGQPEAATRAERLSQQMPPDQINAAQARAQAHTLAHGLARPGANPAPQVQQ